MKCELCSKDHKTEHGLIKTFKRRDGSLYHDYEYSAPHLSTEELSRLPTGHNFVCRNRTECRLRVLQVAVKGQLE